MADLDACDCAAESTRGRVVVGSNRKSNESEMSAALKRRRCEMVYAIVSDRQLVGWAFAGAWKVAGRS